MNKFDTFIFDLDGTLIDSIDLIIFCFQNSFKEVLGIEISNEEVLSKIGKPLRPELSKICSSLNAPIDSAEKILSKYRELQFANHDDKVSVYPNVIETLLSLKQKDIKLGIVTSKGRGGTEAALNLLGEAKNVFSTIITADDSPTHKPDPGPLLIALNNLSSNASNSIYVGDTIFDMQAALAAQITPVGLTYGVANKKILEQFTDIIFDDFKEILGLSTTSSKKYYRNSSNN